MIESEPDPGEGDSTQPASLAPSLPGRVAKVIVDLPIAQPLDYAMLDEVPIGSLCVVPMGRRKVIGVVVGHADTSAIAPSRLKPLGPKLSLQVSAHWLALTRFAADYYHHRWGEIALPVLPPGLRRLPAKRRSRAAPDDAAAPAGDGTLPEPGTAAPENGPGAAPKLHPEQLAAIDAISAADGFAPFCLFGITGSGKTEVYLGALERLLRTPARPQAQVPGAPVALSQALVLVPEINLTPQLQARLQARFPGLPVISLHSAMAPRQRAQAWLEAHEGRARIVLGTRTAVFASLPGLRVIVVDEEHDTSFKAHGGVPFSARDLAVKRAHMEGLPVVLGSATPSLESWQAIAQGRYRRLDLTHRASAQARLPTIEPVDLNHEPLEHGVASRALAAIGQTLERREQVLVFINRRGYAPVLRCPSCDWHTQCPFCDSFAAYHRIGQRLLCHHCGWQSGLPRACPDCGNQDIRAVGQGTQRIEELMRERWPEARIARIDRDSAQGARGADRTGQALQAVHAGDVDILIGTQMITKGHDFRRVSLVVVLNADGQLVAADFRAPERLFATLMQVAGRAGRAGQDARVLIQTRYPGHSLFTALMRADYAGFAQTQLDERQAAAMPPFVHQALITCAAREMPAAIEFLADCARLCADHVGARPVQVYDPVPMPLARLASESRAQILLESASRPSLHAVLDAVLPQLHARGQRGILRWSLDVDPQAV